jgi:heparosan-N-sulfate-glucuronate 5-epimerase
VTKTINRFWNADMSGGSRILADCAAGTLSRRLQYLRRIFAAYLTCRPSQLTFWHEIPEINLRFDSDCLGEYYMTFTAKADYRGEYDEAGIPLLNYHGIIGLQYNPIAIAQYGLGNFNLFRGTNDPKRLVRFMSVADWLLKNLKRNDRSVWVWNHDFDFEYRSILRRPWYSALAQGQGISVLVRAYKETHEPRYLEAADRAFESFETGIDAGGITYVDEEGNPWFEEYIVRPPTHILNGFIWAMWGVYDYFLATGKESARQLFRNAIRTLTQNLWRYDSGLWSLYDQSDTKLKMVASPFYHKLHIVQLRILHRLTGEALFRQYAEKWERYQKSGVRRRAALLQKIVFKLCYY